jgi:hypothetical protein
MFGEWCEGITTACPERSEVASTAKGGMNLSRRAPRGTWHIVGVNFQDLPRQSRDTGIHRKFSSPMKHVSLTERRQGAYHRDGEGVPQHARP